jgi:hypothetical protein
LYKWERWIFDCFGNWILSKNPLFYFCDLSTRSTRLTYNKAEEIGTTTTIMAKKILLRKAFREGVILD